MLNLKILMRMLHPAFSKRLLYIILALALIPLLDCIMVIEMAQLMGEFLFLAILVFLSLTGFIFSSRLIDRVVARINVNLEQNTLSLNHYQSLPGTFVMAYLLIMPGLISTVIGLVCAIPCIRTRLGAKISDFLKIDWREIHEYMNIID